MGRISVSSPRPSSAQGVHPYVKSASFIAEYRAPSSYARTKLRLKEEAGSSRSRQRQKSVTFSRSREKRRFTFMHTVEDPDFSDPSELLLKNVSRTDDQRIRRFQPDFLSPETISYGFLHVGADIVPGAEILIGPARSAFRDDAEILVVQDDDQLGASAVRRQIVHSVSPLFFCNIPQKALFCNRYFPVLHPVLPKKSFAKESSRRTVIDGCAPGTCGRPVRIIRLPLYSLLQAASRCPSAFRSQAVSRCPLAFRSQQAFRSRQAFRSPPVCSCLRGCRSHP